MRTTIPALAAGAALALAVAPTLASAAPAPLPCGFTLGPGAFGLTWPTLDGATVVGRSFPTVVAARQAMARNRFLLNTCAPRPIGGIATVAKRADGFPGARVGDQRFAANVFVGGYVARDLVFVRRGRSIAIIRTAANAEPQQTALLARNVAQAIAP